MSKQPFLPNPSIPKDLLDHAFGPVKIGLTNDYLFHIIFQENKALLANLLCSLLSLKEEDIQSIEVKNPILLGKSHLDKEIILDLFILLNDNRIINIEMQVDEQSFWSDRSLFYTCRSFMSLNKGDDYGKLLPCIHIGILNFNLFPEHEEFHSTFHLLNDRNSSKFSDKLSIHMINLPQTESASAEDRASGLYDWARLFRAKTWEEIKMLAKNNEIIQQAGCAMCYYCADESVYFDCLARQMARMDHVSTVNSSIRKGRAEQKAIDDAVIAAKDAEIAAAIAAKDEALAAKDAEIVTATAAKDEALAEIAALKAQLAQIQSS